MATIKKLPEKQKLLGRRTKVRESFKCFKIEPTRRAIYHLWKHFDNAENTK